MNLKSIPRSAPKQMLPGLKVSDLVKAKYLRPTTVGRVRQICDYGSHLKKYRFLVYILIPGYPEKSFWTEELTKVAVR